MFWLDPLYPLGCAVHNAQAALYYCISKSLCLIVLWRVCIARWIQSFLSLSLALDFFLQPCDSHYDFDDRRLCMVFKKFLKLVGDHFTLQFFGWSSNGIFPKSQLMTCLSWSGTVEMKWTMNLLQLKRLMPSLCPLYDVSLCEPRDVSEFFLPEASSQSISSQLFWTKRDKS